MDASQLEQNRADGSNVYTCRRYTIKKLWEKEKFCRLSYQRVVKYCVLASCFFNMATNDGRVLGIQTTFHATQLEMIEGDKTTAANLFLTNTFFSPNHLVICLTSEFALLQQPFINGNKKRSYKDGHLHCHAAFFFCSIEWQQWQGKLQGLTTT